ncbi:MAG: hypothetical protein KDE19_03930 [Caldilineaceae bacterium]|nr:hypothetical protein [Caldilineaceae bacterium]
MDELLFDALHRLLESHRIELAEQFVIEDVQWGLYEMGEGLIIPAPD